MSELTERIEHALVTARRHLRAGRYDAAMRAIDTAAGRAAELTDEVDGLYRLLALCEGWEEMARRARQALVACRPWLDEAGWSDLVDRALADPKGQEEP